MLGNHIHGILIDANLGTYLGIRKHQNSHKSKLEIWRFENLNNNHATQRDQNNKI